MSATVLFPFVGDSVGGSHISATLLIRHLDPARYKPLVVVHREGPLCDYLTDQGVAWESLPLAGFAGETPRIGHVLAAQLRALPRLGGYLRKRNISAVHSNDLRMHLTWSPAAAVTTTPWIWHQRVLMSASPLWRLLPKLADAVICISHAVKESLPEGARKIAAVVHNPVVPPVAADPASRRSELCATFSIPPAARLIGFVGNMTHQKRPLVFIEAAAKLRQITDDDVYFVLFGDNRGGEHAAALALADRHDLGSRVHFAGHRVPIEPWIAALDLLIAPGIGDGFGRTLVEAMVTGVPVVAADSGAHGEILTHEKTGLLVPPENPSALAEAAHRLLSEPRLAEKIGICALGFALETFDARDHACRVMQIYDRVLGLHSAGPA